MLHQAQQGSDELSRALQVLESLLRPILVFGPSRSDRQKIGVDEEVRKTGLISA